MASEVDITVPEDNVKADKSLFRENFRVIQEEITDLQRETSIAWRIAIGTLPL